MTFVLFRSIEQKILLGIYSPIRFSPINVSLLSRCKQIRR
ncbi:hypothetical protein I3760_13G083400 [Carya illinoinensis]|nr:hypothetical protein I3760_13G083400 [Carya illinoinensis]